ncbi:MAG: ABC transporter ATP-binding protein [Candidatus Heimdallarchaeota archaeon]|nr:ABC transporter ATP-binding protein [Candidatus Heimdallarchaeota archaeon]
MSYISISNLNFSYSKNNLLFENLNLSFEKGEQIAIIGRNGAGKTTLVKLILGMLKPQTGKIIIDSENIKNKSIADIASKVGFVFQNPNVMLFTNSIEKELYLSLVRFKLTKEEIELRITNILEFFNMSAFRKSNPRNLSRGEKQKLVLATVLIQDPQVIILDEPFSGLDVTQQLQIAEYLSELREQNKLIILISHNLDLLFERSSRVIALKNGQLISDSSTEKFLDNMQNLAAVGLEKSHFLELIDNLRKEKLPSKIYTKNALIDFIVNKKQLK